MSFVLLAFPGNNQISPWWYELKVSASMGCFAKEATLWALEYTLGDHILLLVFKYHWHYLKCNSSILAKPTIGAN
jgi:hypothetical protein